MEISGQNLFFLLEKAINDGNSEQLLEFLCNSADEEYLDAVINKRDYIKEILSTKLGSQPKITNILLIILGLAEIASFGPEKSEYLTRCLLSIAVDKRSSIYNLKHVLTMVKSFFEDEHIMEWSSTDESLFVPLKLLGVKLTEIGDYDCQYILLETLWQISEADRNFWADMWFSNQKTRSMFLNLNADQFVLDSRKFLNCINRNEVNRRTFAFVAASVSLGSIELKKPYGSDFWIDFNYDSESISFFCSSLVVENDKTWETIIISSDMVEGYFIKNNKPLKTKELCVTLKYSCSQLLSLEDTSITGLESQLIRVSFWSFLDIHHHTEVIFKNIVSDPGENVSDSQHMTQKRRASESKDLVCFNEQQKSVPSTQNRKPQRRASEPKELLCASYPEETEASSQNYKHRRASESTELVCSSYPQETRTKSQNRKQRTVSESSTLIAAVDLQHYDVNNIETEAPIPEYNLRKRKFTHCKKVSDGYVDSEELNQDTHLTTNCMGEEITMLRSSSNAMDDRKKQNDSAYEKEHDVEPHGNNIDDVDVENNLSLSKHQSQKPIEINSEYFNYLQRSNSDEIYSDDNNEHNSLHNQRGFGEEINSKVDGSSQSKQNRTENLHLMGTSSALQRKSSQTSVDKCSQFVPKRSQNAELLTVSNMSKRKSSQVSVDGCLLSTPKRSQNSELLAVSNMSRRKSSQVSVDGCLLSTPKRSQNSELLAVSNMSRRKSPQVSVDRFLHSTPERSQNANLLAFSNISKRKSPQSVSDSEDICAISPTPINKENTNIPHKLTAQTSKLTNHLSEYTVESKVSKGFSGISSKLSLRNQKNLIESNNRMNTSLNDNRKKKRLYNINRAPVYDVPPSEKRALNDSDEMINSCALNTLFPKESIGINEEENKENELCSFNKAIPQILTNVAISNATKDSVLNPENIEAEVRSLSPITAANATNVQQNVSPEIVENGGQLEEEINDFEIEADTEDYQACINMECDINLQSKKRKRFLDKKNKRTILRGAEEKENTLIAGPQKTHRRAAVNARKRNKLILEQKGSETSFEGSHHTNQRNRSDILGLETKETDVLAPSSPKEKSLLPRKRHFVESDKVEDEMLQNNASKSVKRRKSTKTAKANSENIDDEYDEYAFCTPPPLVKRRGHKHSIFVTDTETGSSEVSWFSKFKLFESPKQSYSNRKKINKALYQKKHVKPKLQRAKKSFKTHQPPSLRSKTSDSESRSKTPFSELERFSLVIEKDKHFQVLPANDLSGLYHTLDYDRRLRQSSIEDDNIQQDYSNEFDIANENENYVDLNGNNVLDATENVTSNNGLKHLRKTKYKMFPPSTSVEVSDVINESNILSKNKRNMKSIKNFGKNKNKEPPKELFRGKKRLADKTMLKYNAKGDKNIESSVGNDSDPIAVSENRSKRLKRNLRQGSEKSLSNSIIKSQSTSNKTPNHFPTLPISLETLIEVSPFKRDKGTSSGRWISPNKMLENTIERPILERKKPFIEESLSLFNDEKRGKKIHLDYFLESMSSVSPSAENLDITEAAELSTTLKKSTTKPRNSNSRENIAKDYFSKQKQQSSKHHNLNLTQENFEEEEHSEKQISGTEPPESSFQELLPIFQKTPTKDKMSCEDNLPTKPVLHILSDEVNTLTHRLFLTLKKCMSDFREKMVALRVSIVNTADNMISNESKFTEKDLGSLARSCRESRIHIQKHLKKLYVMGTEYFESEKRLERSLAKKHKKAVLKYTKRLQMAQNIADKALEDRFILKSRAYLKSLLKKMELL